MDREQLYFITVGINISEKKIDFLTLSSALHLRSAYDFNWS